MQLAATQHGAAVASLLDKPQVQSSGTCTAPGVQFAYSYMVTNRATPFAPYRSEGIVPSAPGTLTFWTAPGAYQSSDPQTNYTFADSIQCRKGADPVGTDVDGTLPDDAGVTKSVDANGLLVGTYVCTIVITDP